MAHFISEALGPQHELSAFRSGQGELDAWLTHSALHAAAMRTAKTFVWHRDDEQVVAYFSLAAHLVVRDELPKKAARGAPGAIPAILLAKLALHGTLHGKGLGGELLWDSLSRAVSASEIAAARVIVVDAIDGAAVRFYEHHGFVAIPKNRHRLVQKVSDIAAALGKT